MSPRDSRGVLPRCRPSGHVSYRAPITLLAQVPVSVSLRYPLKSKTWAELHSMYASGLPEFFCGTASVSAAS